MCASLTTRQTGRDPGFEAKLAFLAHPGAYPDRPAAVDSIETHMSRVFLAGDHAYKLKKPSRSDHIDFTTLAARRRNCEEELRLNRRLAAGVYEGLSTLSVDSAGRLSLDGPGGTVVDYLVRMRRLPIERTLEWRLRSGAPDESQIGPAAMLLADFYAHLPPVPFRPARYWGRFRDDIGSNRNVLCDPLFGLSAECVLRVCGLQFDAIHRLRDTIESRARDGKLVEGHGDLRPEHVYLGDPPAIIDCLEFQRELRILDPADDLGFLAMECERLGADYVHRLLFDTYRRTSGDAPEDDLVHFYKSYRACIRARLAVLHLREPQFARSPRWAAQAREYLRLALLHLDRIS